MTSFRQIEANRRNAVKSTGPVTERGKRRSRQNAVRHGLCAETVVETIEDLEDYRGFEAAVIADYDARTAVERELVLRLASLLWRLRRATAIETDLLRFQAEILRDPKQERSQQQADNYASPCFDEAVASLSDVSCQPCRTDSLALVETINWTRQLTYCFQRLVNDDDSIFERLSRYETAIARQVLKTLYLVQSIRHR